MRKKRDLARVFFTPRRTLDSYEFYEEWWFYEYLLNRKKNDYEALLNESFMSIV